MLVDNLQFASSVLLDIVTCIIVSMTLMYIGSCLKTNCWSDIFHSNEVYIALATSSNTHVIFATCNKMIYSQLSRTFNCFHIRTTTSCKMIFLLLCFYSFKVFDYKNKHSEFWLYIYLASEGPEMLIIVIWTPLSKK